MNPSDILKRIDRVGSLATLPAVAEKINEAVAQDTCTSAVLAGIIEKDASLSAKVLKLANSSFYGLSRRVDTITRAITVLGFNLVRDTALTVSVHRMFSQQVAGIDVEGLWLHSLACGVAAKDALSFQQGSGGHEAFLGGVLHDIGVLLISRLVPDKTRELYSGRHTVADVLASERKCIGITHAEVGAYASEQWHFPASLVEMIRCHHHPRSARLSPRTAAAVCVGNEIAKALQLGTSISFFVSEIEPEVWGMLGITAADMPRLVTTVHNDFETACDLFAG